MSVLTIKVLCGEDVELPSHVTTSMTGGKPGLRDAIGYEVRLDRILATYDTVGMLSQFEKLYDLVISGTYEISLVLSKDCYIKVVDLVHKEGTLRWAANPDKVAAMFNDGTYLSYTSCEAEPHIIYAYKEPKTFLGLESGDWVVACILGVLVIMFGLFIIAMFAIVISGPPL